MYHSHQHDHNANYVPADSNPPPPSTVLNNGTVSAQQYHPHYMSSNIHAQAHGASIHRWSTGLCHCFDDPGNCLVTCFCPCITFGQIAEVMNKGAATCVTYGVIYGLLGMTCTACLYSCFYRSKLRAQYDLDEAPCVDCLVHCFCEMCALCQEHRELRNHGFDMGIGWQANMDRQSRGVAVIAPPIMDGGMHR